MKRKTKLVAKVPQSFKDKIDEIASKSGIRRGPCIKHLCKLALSDYDYPRLKVDEGLAKDSTISVHVYKEWLDDMLPYRAHHKFLTHKDVFLDSLCRGIAIHLNGEAPDVEDDELS